MFTNGYLHHNFSRKDYQLIFQSLHFSIMILVSVPRIAHKKYPKGSGKCHGARGFHKKSG